MNKTTPSPDETGIRDRACTQLDRLGLPCRRASHSGRAARSELMFNCIDDDDDDEDDNDDTCGGSKSGTLVPMT